MKLSTMNKHCSLIMNLIIHTFFLFSLLFISPFVLASPPPNIYEMNVKGMTCSFCAYGIEKNLNKLSGVKKAQVSLEQKKIRVEMKEGQAFNEEEVRAVITDSGFTPGELITQDSEQ